MKSKYISPNSLFSETAGYMSGPQYNDLNQSFAETRYQYIPGQGAQFKNDNQDRLKFSKNAAAIKIFPSPDDSQQQAIIKNAISTPISVKHRPSPLGHSERLAFRDALDELYKNVYPEYKQHAPSSYSFDKRENLSEEDKERIILEKLVENANRHQGMLDYGQHKVGLQTERPPCTPENGCSAFLQDIIPRNPENKVGFAVKNYRANEPDSGASQVQPASEEIRKAYQDYMNNLFSSPISIASSSSPDYFKNVGDDISFDILSPNRSSIVEEYQPYLRSPRQSQSREEMIKDFNRQIFGSSSDSDNDMPSSSSSSQYLDPYYRNARHQGNYSGMDTSSDSDPIYDSASYNADFSKWPGARGFTPSRKF